MSKVIGKVAQIIGPVVDVVFNGKDVELPKIYDSLEITKKDGTLLVLKYNLTLVKTRFVPFRWTQQMV
jgi:F-type H+-transporting ATPase subunit beta